MATRHVSYWITEDGSDLARQVGQNEWDALVERAFGGVASPAWTTAGLHGHMVDIIVPDDQDIAEDKLASELLRQFRVKVASRRRSTPAERHIASCKSARVDVTGNPSVLSCPHVFPVDWKR